MIVTSPVLPLTVIILILSLLAILFVVLELKRQHRYRSMRLIAIIILMASLAGIMLRPKYSSRKSDAVLLLTAGYSEQQVDSILSRHSDLSVMYLSNARPFKNASLLPDLQIANHNIEFILGEGLLLHQLDKLKDITYTYIPMRDPEGLVSINIEEKYESNRTGIITGSYNNQRGRILISLHGPAGAEDSVIISKKGPNQFSLSFLARQPGNFAYTLTVRDSLRETQETIPIHVSDSRKLEILFLQYHPSFETQYLKSFLSQKNHRMILRAQLSKNNFRNEFINREGVSVTRLSEQLLSGMDLVVADATSLNMLTKGEKAALEKSVKLGLGLLTLPPIGKISSGYFPFETVAVKKDTTLIRVGQKSFTISAKPMRVQKKQGVIPLLSNKSGALNGYTFNRAGKIGFQLLQETFQLRLAGDSLAYAEIWSPVLENVARRKEENSSIKIVTPFPWYEDEPIEIEVLSATEKIRLTDDSTFISLRENFIVDNVWHGRTWGSKKGWHMLRTDHGAVKPYYVQSRPAWNALSIKNQMRINGLKSKVNSKVDSNQIPIMKDVPPIVFYLTLILSAGYIWLAPRL